MVVVEDPELFDVEEKKMDQGEEIWGRQYDLRVSCLSLYFSVVFPFHMSVILTLLPMTLLEQVVVATTATTGATTTNKTK